MDKVTLGRTGLKVGVAGLGCGGFSRLGLATGNYMLEFEAVSSDQKSRTLWGFKIGS